MGCTCENSKSEANIELQKPPEELSQKLINSTITIQSHIRGYLLRKKLYDKYIELMQNLHPSKKNLPKNKKQLAILSLSVACPAMLWVVDKSLLSGLTKEEMALWENVVKIRTKHGGAIVLM